MSSVGGAAFALLKADGSVVAWGDASSGGHLSRSQETTERDLRSRERREGFFPKNPDFCLDPLLE